MCSIFFLRTVYLTLSPSLKLSEIFNFLLHLRFSVPLIFPPSLPTFPCKNNIFYDENLVPPPFPSKLFIQLMQTATSAVGFSFNNAMYWLIIRFAVESLLGPALANIFVGYQETKLFLNVKKPRIHYHYQKTSQILLTSLHSSLHFMLEEEINSFLPFRDVLVMKRKIGFITSVYRKRTLLPNTYIGILLAL